MTEEENKNDSGDVPAQEDPGQNEEENKRPEQEDKRDEEQQVENQAETKEHATETTNKDTTDHDEGGASEEKQESEQETKLDPQQVQSEVAEKKEGIFCACVYIVDDYINSLLSKNLEKMLQAKKMVSQNRQKQLKIEKLLLKKHRKKQSQFQLRDLLQNTVVYQSKVMHPGRRRTVKYDLPFVFIISDTYITADNVIISGQKEGKEAKEEVKAEQF